MAKLEQGACGENILYPELAQEMAKGWATVASSQAARVNMASAAPGVKRILCCMKVWVLTRAWSLSLSTENAAPATTNAAGYCSWVTCAYPWVGVWAAELFLCLPSLSTVCNRIPQAPSAFSRARGIANVKHCTLAGKETGFLTSFFSLSKFLKPYLPISCVAHHSS